MSISAKFMKKFVTTFQKNKDVELFGSILFDKASDGKFTTEITRDTVWYTQLETLIEQGIRNAKILDNYEKISNYRDEISKFLPRIAEWMSFVDTILDGVGNDNRFKRHLAYIAMFKRIDVSGRDAVVRVHKFMAQILGIDEVQKIKLY